MGEQWAKFSKRWMAILNERGLPYFHFLEFANQSGSLTSEQRNSILSSLIEAIKDCVILAVSSRISAIDYESLTTSDFRSKYGSAYSLGVIGCITDAGLHLKQRSYDYCDLGIYLEQGHRNLNHTLEMLRWIKRSDEEPDLPPALRKGGHVTRVIDANREQAPVKIGICWRTVPARSPTKRYLKCL